MACAGVASGQTALPDGFAIAPFAEGFNQPTALAFAPDGRLFVAEKGGAIWIVENGAVASEPFVAIEAYTFSECGLLGLALDPDFADNGWVYCFVTVSADEQQIIRFRDADGVGVERMVIRDNLPTRGLNHNGGCLRFGPDGKLYFSIGDNGDSSRSQSMHTFAGKLCRIEPDGSVPADNPFVTPTGAPSAIYALGFRNPFRFCFAPDGRLFLCDVGSSGDGRREEINLVEAGGNYGWPEVEGFGDDETDPAYLNPLIAYHDAGASIAGCVYYSADRFPAAYRDGLFHLDYVSDGLFHVNLSTGMAAHTRFADLDAGPVDLAVGPDGNLYYAAIATGDVMRLAFGDAELVLDDDDNDDIVAPAPNPCGSGTSTAMMVMMMMIVGYHVVDNRSNRRLRVRAVFAAGVDHVLKLLIQIFPIPPPALTQRTICDRQA